MRPRPLSPHLSVYRFKYTLTTSILNRATGLVLSLTLVPLVLWLSAVASGPQDYARVSAWLQCPGARVPELLLVAALWYHLIAGMRHLMWDTGHGMERAQARRGAWVVGALTLVLTALTAAWLMLTGSAT